MRWLVLDEILEIRKGASAKTRSRVPQAPVSAEPLLLEMMAQTAGLVLGLEADYQQDLIIAKIENALFEPLPSPGISLEISASSDQLRPEGAWFDCAACGPGGLIASARIMLMNVGLLVPEKQEPVTFHRVFMDHFQVRTHAAAAAVDGRKT